MQTRNQDELRQWCEEHMTAAPEHYALDESIPVFFYGGEFSNFVGGPFWIESMQPWGSCPLAYRTTEHFYQASKAKTKRDHLQIASEWNTWNAKHLGQHVDLRPDWEHVKYEVMLHALRIKFNLEPWREALVLTGDRWIAEDSPTDEIWGIRDAEGGFTGQNLLGLALMQVRDEIRNGFDG